MIKKTLRCFRFVVYAQLVVFTSLNAAEYYNIKPVRDIFVGTLPNDEVDSENKQEELTMVMERLCDSNLAKWRGFSKLYRRYAKQTYAGLDYFDQVVQKDTYSEYPIWIAYITNQPRREIEQGKDPDAGSVGSKYYVRIAFTVTSHPEALISTHLGIQSFTTIRYLSMPLHAFAAKVSLMKNPKLLYMVNCPAWAMEKIIAQSLPPKSVFIGTKEMTQAEKQILLHLEVGKEIFNMMPSMPPIISTIPGKITIYDPQNPNKELVSMEKNSAIYGWMFNTEFRPAISTHYVAVDIKQLSEYVPERILVALRQGNIDLIIGFQKNSSKEFYAWLCRKDKHGDYPLIIAAKQNNTVFIENFVYKTIPLKLLGQILMLDDDKGNTPIMIALLNKNASIVNLFLDTINRAKDIQKIREFYASHTNINQQKLIDIANQWDGIDAALKNKITKFVTLDEKIN